MDCHPLKNTSKNLHQYLPAPGNPGPGYRLDSPHTTFPAIALHFYLLDSPGSCCLWASDWLFPISLDIGARLLSVLSPVSLFSMMLPHQALRGHSVFNQALFFSQSPYHNLTLYHIFLSELTLNFPH